MLARRVLHEAARRVSAKLLVVNGAEVRSPVCGHVSAALCMQGC